LRVGRPDRPRPARRDQPDRLPVPPRGPPGPDRTHGVRTPAGRRPHEGPLRRRHHGVLCAGARRTRGLHLAIRDRGLGHRLPAPTPTSTPRSATSTCAAPAPNPPATTTAPAPANTGTAGSSAATGETNSTQAATTTVLYGSIHISPGQRTNRCSAANGSTYYA